MGNPSERDITNSPRPSLRRRMRGGLENAVNFVRVSPQMHAFSAIEAVAGTGIGAGVFELQNVNPLATLGGIVVGGFLELALFRKIADHQGSAAANLRIYKRVKTDLQNHGWDERFIKPELHWWCFRYAARKAAIDTGYRKEVTEYYKRMGASWLKFEAT